MKKLVRGSRSGRTLAATALALGFVVSGFVVGASSIATAADEPTVTLTLKNHKFDPAVPTVPAGVRVKLTATNLDDSPAEVESDDFKLEKVVPAGKSITVMIGPLKAGTYHIYDEYHEDESRTEFIAK